MSRSHQIPSFNPIPGNTRVSLNQKGIILQDNSYYPFDMSLETPGTASSVHA